MTDDLQGEVETVSQPAAPEQPEEAPSVAAEEESHDERTETALDRLDARLAEAQRLLARQAELTEKLHGENQSLRAGELRNAQMPLVRDLIRLYDDLGRMCAVATDSADLAMVQQSLFDVLARNGVQRFEAEQGEPFDSRTHSAAGAESTADEQLDRTVAEVVRPGFRWDSGEVIRVVEVRAYRYSGSG